MSIIKKMYSKIDFWNGLFKPLLMCGALALSAKVFSFEIMVMGAFAILLLKKNA
jgi:hypothetical protein